MNFSLCEVQKVFNSSIDCTNLHDAYLKCMEGPVHIPVGVTDVLSIHTTKLKKKKLQSSLNK